MSQANNWEADKMLDVYIYDYLVKRNLQASAKAFQAEGKVSPEPVAIDAPGGFLFEWWSVFWDIFIARTNEKHSDVAASYIETQSLKAREQHQQQQPTNQQQQQQQQIQMQQMLLMKQRQQQQPPTREGGHLLNGSTNGLISNDSLIRQNQGTANAMATKMYEERLKLPQRDSLEDGTIKRFGDNVGPLLDANQSNVIKSSSTPGQPSGQVLHNMSGNMSAALQQVQGRNQQLPVATQEIKTEMNTVLGQRSGTSDASLFGVPGGVHSKPNLLSTGPAQGGNNPPLRGWPLTAVQGLDQLRPSLLQPQKSFIQSPTPYQLQMLGPQHQQLLMHAQASSNLNDMESRKLRTLLSRSFSGKDGQPNAIGDVTQNLGSSLQGLSAMPRPETEMLLKMRMAQLQQQEQQQQQQQQQQNQNNNAQQPQQQALSNQQSQGNSHQQQQEEKVGVSNVTGDGSLSNSFRASDQNGSKGQNGRKRKQPGSSSGPANSSGTANTAGPSLSSAPSTPSNQTPGDVMTMTGTLQHSGSSSKPLMMYGSDGTGPLASPSNPLADIDRFVEDGSLEDNVESYLSHDDADPREPVGRCMDVNQEFSFTEVTTIRASSSKVVCCHFSSDGKLLASAGHEKKAVLWNMDTLKLRSSLEEHSFLITDVRFSPNSTRLATSSFDRTVKVWDADNPSYSLRTFAGHITSVMSLDFHPMNEDLICSCDANGEIRYWSVSQGQYTSIFKGGVSQTRFQPQFGRFLAAASESVISIFDVETEACLHSLRRHTKPVHSLCWDASGDYMASVSEDSVRVWALGNGSDGECVHELNSSGNKFHSCVFHPNYPSLLIIGCYQSLELWNMTENKTMIIPAHDGLVAALAASSGTGMVASASHDKSVKLWK
eukprot:TRINITY_DN1568_c0_g6_i2.p1 TRINITY_DN1568_c0_g6~~TRINITY_DN1568_c0_g6_i2.p1  ORF type:complete len:882 (-),score=202.48 TRINITY_DN1568_c0_g6_i2:799-3444(-)